MTSETTAAYDGEVLEGEFAAVEAEIGALEESADVPVPEDLLTDGGEGGGSARYPLPEDLVRVQYRPVPVRYLTAPARLDARVIPAADASLVPADLGQYETVAGSADRAMGPGGAVRVARLRDLYARLLAAQENLRLFQEREEAVRANVNLRNNLNNERIDKDLSELREWWQAERERCRKELRETEKQLTEYRVNRYPEIQEARKAYWAVRAAAARERDDREKAERESADEATAERRQEEKQHAAEAREQRAADAEEGRRRAVQAEQDAAGRAADAERAAREAEQAVAAAEGDAAKRLRLEIEQLRRHCDEVVAATLERLSLEEAALEAEAAEAEARLLAEKAGREAWLHEARLRAAREREERERQLGEARESAAHAAADAGLAPGEWEQPGYLDALQGRVAEDAVAGGSATRTEHLERAAESPRRTWFHRVAVGLGTLACGTVFGLSLGILTSLVDLDMEMLRQQWMVALGICVLGIFIFFLMGRVVKKAAAYASEELHATGSGRGVPAAIGTGLLIAVLIGIEACVERYGIVKGVMETSVSATLGQGAETENEIVYWAIALVVAAPFVLYHAYEGAMETRYRLAAKRRRERLAERRLDVLDRAEVRRVCAAAERVRIAEGRLDALEADQAAYLDEARRRLDEAEAALTEHPAIRRRDERAAARQGMLDADPAVRRARAELDEAERRLDADPELGAVRRRAADLRADADAARAEAEAASRAVDSLLGIAPNVTTTLADAAARAVDALAPANGVGAAAGATPSLASSVAGGAAAGAVSGAVRGVITGGLPGAVSGAAGGAFGGAVSGALRAAMSSPPSAAATDPASEPSEWTSRRRYAPQTWEEAAAVAKLRELAAVLREDPQVASCRRRLAALRAEIHSLDTRYGKRRRQLLDQKRAVELRPDTGTGAVTLQDLYDQRDAAQILFDHEMYLLKRLVECPRPFRWMVVLHQNFFARDVVMKRIEEARRERQVSLPSSPLPALPRAVAAGDAPRES